MSKTPSELMAMPAEDLEFLLASLVDEQRRLVTLIEDMSRTEKLTPEVYAVLMRDVL